jgi:hypothetical protein
MVASVLNMGDSCVNAAMDTDQSQMVARRASQRNLCLSGDVHQQTFPQDSTMTLPRFPVSWQLTTVLAWLVLGTALAAEPTTPSTDTGRDLVLRYLHDLDCGTAAMAATAGSNARFEARMLQRVPPAQHAAERETRVQALARRSSGCEHVEHLVRDVSIQYDPDTTALLRQAAVAGDRFARLRSAALAVDDPAAIERSRMQLVEILHSGDALAISDIGRALAMSRDPSVYGSATEAGDMTVVDTWLLVACDLGLECAAGSREMDRWCLHYGGGCAQADLAGAVSLVHGQAYFLKIDAHRRALLAQIRSRDWQGVFAPLAKDAT